jgi:thiamine-phosphate pyrophosphorylase
MAPMSERRTAIRGLYAIVDTRLAASPGQAAGVLFRAGVRILQYRHKGPIRREHWEECCRIAAQAREAGALFLVNDRADLALISGAAGVHLGQDDVPPQKARRLLGADAIIGVSTHSPDQARQAEALPVDYVAIGPVFPTSSKERPDPVVGLDTVRAVRAIISKPLVAIGGITLQNARDAIEAGADAVAVIRDLLAAPDLEARARLYVQALG